MVDRIIVNLDPNELGTLGDTLLGNAERCIPGQPGFKPVGVKIKVVWRRDAVARCVGIRCGAISNEMKLSFQAARSIG
jgi:hypothetical protein